MSESTHNDDIALADYRCKWCGKVVKRRSAKAWIKSMCDDTGYKTVHLMRVARPGGES